MPPWRRTNHARRSLPTPHPRLRRPAPLSPGKAGSAATARGRRGEAWRLANAVRANGYDRGDPIAILSETRSGICGMLCRPWPALGNHRRDAETSAFVPMEIAVCLPQGSSQLPVLTSGTAGGVARRPPVRVFRTVGDWISIRAGCRASTDYEAILAEKQRRTSRLRIAEGRGTSNNNPFSPVARPGQPKGAPREPARRRPTPRLCVLLKWFGLTEKDGFRRLAAALPLRRETSHSTATFLTGGHLCDIQAASIYRPCTERHRGASG